MKKAAVVVGLLMIGLVVSPGLWSQDKDHAELAKAVAGAKVSLEQGLTASARGKTHFSEIRDRRRQIAAFGIYGQG